MTTSTRAAATEPAAPSAGRATPSAAPVNQSAGPVNQSAGRVNQGAGRVNQKARTRAAIVRAVQDLARDGAEITMPSVARAALVSEATAYRYLLMFIYSRCTIAGPRDAHGRSRHGVHPGAWP